MNTPQHIAFIMDGNRRWAKSHKLAMLLGHNKGAHQIEPLVEYAAKKGIKFVTFWAFSTENWQRTEQEVAVLMEVFRRMFTDPMVDRMKKKDVKFSVIGDISKFSQDIQDNVSSLLEDTKDNKKITVTIALNYGGREEIIRAMRAASSINPAPSSISDEEFADVINRNLDTRDIPDPDLLIRTGGEKRLSGFMPWQTVYTELYFTDTLWPEFDEHGLQNALDDFTLRVRRFGK